MDDSCLCDGQNILWWMTSKLRSMIRLISFVLCQIFVWILSHSSGCELSSYPFLPSQGKMRGSQFSKIWKFFFDVKLMKYGILIFFNWNSQCSLFQSSWFSWDSLAKQMVLFQQIAVEIQQCLQLCKCGCGLSELFVLWHREHVTCSCWRTPWCHRFPLQVLYVELQTFIKMLNDAATWARGRADGWLGAEQECWRSWNGRFDQCVSAHGWSGDVVAAMFRAHCLIWRIICTQVKVNKTEITR